MTTNPQSPAPATPADDNVLPPWVVVGDTFYGHRDWVIESIVGQWIEVAEKRATSGQPSKAWIYLPTGVVYGSTTLLRRSEHGLPITTR